MSTAIDRIVAEEEAETAAHMTPAEAASRISELAGLLRAHWPEASELIQATAGGVGVAESARESRGSSRPSMRRLLDAKADRLRGDHARALGALRLGTAHRGGEEAYTLACHLREAACALAAVRVEGFTDGKDDEEREEPLHPDADAEQRAVVWARRDARVAHLSDRELLAVLRRFALPRNTKIGDGVPRGGLSATEEADLCRAILLLPANSAAALARDMQRAAKQRAERFAPELDACDRTCRERATSPDEMVTACTGPQHNNEKHSDTESSATACRSSLPLSASRRAR